MASEEGGESGVLEKGRQQRRWRWRWRWRWDEGTKIFQKEDEEAEESVQAARRLRR